MRVTPYKIDIEKNYDAVIKYLTERNPKTAETVEE